MAAQRVAEVQLPTHYGEFRCIVYSTPDGAEQIALLAGAVDESMPATVRLHSECLTGDVFGSLRCDCGVQLEDSLRYLQTAGSGILLYLRQEGRGIGLGNKIRAYALQEQGYDTVEANTMLGFPADARDYRYAAEILGDLGVREVRLLTNNPAKMTGLEQYGIHVVEQIPLEVVPNPANDAYLRTKVAKMGHLLRSTGAPRTNANS